MTTSLRVTSHVARDLLQSAGLFKHAHLVVWEYVSNGLQYVDPGISPEVDVNVSKDRISITDNGRGMSYDDLNRFFTMHGENQDRLEGRPGRGTFGTGKSAAFAIADRLRITTVKNGKRSVVELTRHDLEDASSGAAVPVRELEIECVTPESNGTKIEITELKRVRIDNIEIERHIERNLRHWRGVTVHLNDRQIEPTSPAVNETYEFVATAHDSPLIAGSKLIISVSKAPLPEEDRGIAILSNGVLHEITLAGSEKKEFSNYLFGEIDIPLLSEPWEGVDAYDMSRSGRLNPENRVVTAAMSFVGRHVERIRKELLDRDRDRRRRAEAARLREQAEQIARIINDDYAEFARRFKPVQSLRVGAADLLDAPRASPSGDPVLVPGDALPALEITEDLAVPLQEEVGPRVDPGPEHAPTPPALEPAPADNSTTTANEMPADAKAKRRSGGFNVRFEENGSENPRCFYQRESRTLIINLDHPQLVAARDGGTIEEPMFRRLSFEVALTEYAISLAQENVLGGFYQDMFDPLIEARDRIDSLARRGAGLFANGPL
jgi:hypothetical protein